MGRRSYEIMGPHWATSEGPIATAMSEKPKAVFSHTLQTAEWGPVEIFGGDVSAGIADLKARDDGATILVHGGPDFAKSLTRLGLVDEYQLMTVPIAIGAGRSPFADLRAHLKLDVVDEERFASGALAQILKPKRRVTPAWSPTARREPTRSRCIPNSRSRLQRISGSSAERLIGTVHPQHMIMSAAIRAKR